MSEYKCLTAAAKNAIDILIFIKPTWDKYLCCKCSDVRFCYCWGDAPTRPICVL